MPREKKPHLKKRSDGRYRCKFNGLEFYGRTEEEALSAREEYKRSIITGKVNITQLTVADYAIPWLRRTYPSVTDSTYTGLAIHLQHLVDRIGNKRISEVVPSDIKDVYSTEYNGLSNTYILAAKQLYCSLFDSAVEDSLTRFNPARAKAARPHKGNRPKQEPLTPQQVEWITTLCVNHRAYPAVMAMLYAGLRPQEAKALNIDRDVDFENNVITVQETAHVDGQKYRYTGDMKTEWSYRRIPLFTPLKQALSGRHGYLVTSAHGERVTVQTWKVLWRSYLHCMETAINGVDKRWYGRRRKDLNKELPPWVSFDIVPYTLRHTFCHMCRDLGVEINTCRHWMGHADTRMILQVYDAVSDDRSTAERVKVESRIGGQIGGSAIYNAPCNYAISCNRE